MTAPAQNNRLSPQKLSQLKKTVKKMIGQGRLAEAKKGLQQYIEQQPDDLENYTLTGVIFILEGKLAEAEKVLLDGIRRQPGNCDLLFNLGYLDERRRENISALDLYRRAELTAETGQQLEDIREAVQRVTKNIKGTMLIRDDAYYISLEGNREPLQLQYMFQQLVEHKQILEAVLENMDSRVKTVLVLESEEWVVPKNFKDMGLKVKAYTPGVDAILKAMGVEFLEKVRTAGTTPVQYYQAKIDKRSAGQLPGSDLIVLLPGKLGWYRDMGVETAGRVLAAAAGKASRQLFFYIPAAAEAEEMTSGLLAALKQMDLPADKLTVCWKGEDGSRLCRLDKSGHVKTKTAELVPRGMDALRSKRAVFEVGVDKCRDLNGMAYTKKGWNHFVAQLRQLKNNPGLAYEDAILKAYYERFTPRNRQEQLFEEDEKEMEPICRGWTLLPWMDSKGLMVNSRQRPESRPGGNHHFGPNSEEFGRREFMMIKDTFAMIQRMGYHPEIFPDGHIQGYLLKSGDDYRFIVSEGQHRMAVVGMLGYEIIKCRHNLHYPRVVDLKNAGQWPQVKSGLYSRELAERVFRYYFESSGRRKAENLGLL